MELTEGEWLRATQKATDRYLTLFNHMDQGFCIIEMIFDEKGTACDYRFLEVNPVFEKQTGLKDVSSKAMADGVKVSVQDEGYGIPESDQPKVFDRFFRVTSNNMDRYPGMGLGLYISAQIIQRHGGTIDVQSLLGKGSVFSFTLPI